MKNNFNRRKLRVALITATFPPHYTGTGNVAYHNAVQLARRDHEVHVYTALVDGAPANELLEGIHVHRFKPWLRYGNASFMPTLYSHLRDFDLLHLHLPFYGGSEAVYLLLQTRKIPLVITYHQDVQLAGIAGIISQVHDRLIGQPLMEMADRACFTSLDYGRASKLEPQISAGKLNESELPNGVDVTRFTPGPPDLGLVKRYDTKGCATILFVGGLDRAHYFKGVENLIEAVARLDRDDIRLLVVGKGDMQPYYRQLMQAQGLDNIVHFAGFVSADELPDYYRLADVTVLPSTTAGEAFGLVLIESMACRTPVIASDLAGVRTVVSSPDDGYLVEPGNIEDLSQKLDQMLCLSHEERRIMGQEGRRKVEELYTWENIGDLLEQIYAEVLQKDLGRLAAVSQANSASCN